MRVIIPISAKILHVSPFVASLHVPNSLSHHYTSSTTPRQLPHYTTPRSALQQPRPSLPITTRSKYRGAGRDPHGHDATCAGSCAPIQHTLPRKRDGADSTRGGAPPDPNVCDATCAGTPTAPVDATPRNTKKHKFISHQLSRSPTRHITQSSDIYPIVARPQSRLHQHHHHYRPPSHRNVAEHSFPLFQLPRIPVAPQQQTTLYIHQILGSRGPGSAVLGARTLGAARPPAPLSTSQSVQLSGHAHSQPAQRTHRPPPPRFDHVVGFDARADVAPPHCREHLVPNHSRAATARIS